MSKGAVSAMWILIFIVAVGINVGVALGWNLGLAASLSLAAIDEMTRGSK